MTLDQRDIDELMKKHGKDSQIAQPKMSEELGYIGKLILQGIIFGLIFFPLVGLILTLIVLHEINTLAIALTTANIAGYTMMIAGLLFAIGYLAGSKVFMAEMARRAWTNSKPRTDKSAIEDFRRFASPSNLIRNLFFGSLFMYILLSVFIIPAIL